jgi:hypothetical protein
MHFALNFTSFIFILFFNLLYKLCSLALLQVIFSCWVFFLFFFIFYSLDSCFHYSLLTIFFTLYYSLTLWVLLFNDIGFCSLILWVSLSFNSSTFFVGFVLYLDFVLNSIVVMFFYISKLLVLLKIKYKF